MTAQRPALDQVVNGAVGKLSVGHLKLSGTGLSVLLRCGGSGTCKLKLTISALETTRDGKLARASQRMVVIATKTVTLLAGKHRTVTLKLNRTGDRLLAKDHLLKARLKILNHGRSVASRTVTFRLRKP